MQAEIETFIRNRGNGADFEETALEVFAYQYRNCSVYHDFCRRRGRTPVDVVRLDDIPALPTEAFKGDLGFVERRPFAFRSSGTTQGTHKRSHHALRNLDSYRLSAMTHFADMVLADQPGPMSVLVLGPSRQSSRDSSLGRMFTWCCSEFGDAAARVAFDSRGKADIDSALSWLRNAAESARPALILSISSALTALFTAMRSHDEPLRLPADSRIVDTGGGKGVAPVFSPRGILKAAWRYLHVPAYACLNQYGMTEMLSQFYDDTLLTRVEGGLSPRAKLGPAWVHTTVVDPVGLTPVAEGERGILRHFDLANWDTVSCLQTLDLGRKRGRGFELCGRMPMAESRGCSQLMVGFNDLPLP